MLFVETPEEAAAASAAGIDMLSIIDPLWTPAMPSPNSSTDCRSAPMTEWIDACGVDDVEAEDVMRFDHAGRTFAIYRSPEDEWFCTDGLCSHEQVHLSGGLNGMHDLCWPGHRGLWPDRVRYPRGFLSRLVPGQRCASNPSP